MHQHRHRHRHWGGRHVPIEEARGLDRTSPPHTTDGGHRRCFLFPLTGKGAEREDTGRGRGRVSRQAGGGKGGVEGQRGRPLGCV